MPKETLRSLALPLVVLAGALAVFASIPFQITRESAAQKRQADAARRAEQRAVLTAPKLTTTAMGGLIRFTDVEKQSREFIGYYHTIELTPEQEAIKAEVLKASPAACCNDATAYTCCCPCNLSKTLWGLSNHVLADRGATAEQLKEVVDAWTAAVNPNGFGGRACHQGGCERPFQSDGCGGMSESRLAV